MKVKRIEGVGAQKPLCEHKVHVSPKGTSTANTRRWLAKRKGLEPDQCGHRADFRVGGMPMCRSHAGHWCLNHMLSEGETT